MTPPVNMIRKAIYQHIDLTDGVVFDFQEVTIDLLDPKNMVQQVLEQVTNDKQVIEDFTHKFKRTTMGFRYKTNDSVYLILYLK